MRKKEYARAKSNWINVAAHINGVNKEATIKTTALLEPIVKRILSTDIQAQYLLMDSWFTMPTTVISLAQHIKAIGMVKK